MELNIERGSFYLEKVRSQVLRFCNSSLCTLLLGLLFIFSLYYLISAAVRLPGSSERNEYEGLHRPVSSNGQKSSGDFKRHLTKPNMRFNQIDSHQNCYYDKKIITQNLPFNIWNETNSSEPNLLTNDLFYKERNLIKLNKKFILDKNSNISGLVLNLTIRGAESLFLLRDCWLFGVSWASDYSFYEDFISLVKINKNKTFFSTPQIYNFIKISCLLEETNRVLKGEKQTFVTFNQTLISLSEKTKIKQKTRDLSSPLLPNILLILIDSLSQSSYLGNLKKTQNFFISQKSQILHGLNALGSDLESLVFPLLTGHEEDHWRKWRKGDFYGNYVDNIPFLWNKFEQKGYATCFGESEEENKEGVFHQKYLGFEFEPVDHYMRPFWLQTNRISKESRKENYKKVLTYLSQFQESYHNHSKFSFGILKDFERSSEFDDNLSNFFINLSSKNLLNNTIVFLVGSPENQTNSTLEQMFNSRLPLGLVSFPQNFENKEFSFVTKNSHHLLTPFDLRETLLSIIGTKKNSKSYNSILKELPKDRTCKSANIHPVFCTCQKFIQADLNENQTQKIVLKASEALISHINYLLNSQMLYQCGLFSKFSVLTSKIIIPNEYMLRRKKIWKINFEKNMEIEKIYLLIQTVPENFIFEAVVEIRKNKFFTVDHQILRKNSKEENCHSNIYGFLKDFCHCN